MLCKSNNLYKGYSAKIHFSYRNYEKYFFSGNPVLIGVFQLLFFLYKILCLFLRRRFITASRSY